MAKLLAHVPSHGRPYLVGGDWNMKADEIRRTLPSGVGKLLAPSLPTCVTAGAPSTIDYWL
eukprot:11585721-Alexandrium_andersonii.AAC.1